MKNIFVMENVYLWLMHTHVIPVCLMVHFVQNLKVRVPVVAVLLMKALELAPKYVYLKLVGFVVQL